MMKTLWNVALLSLFVVVGCISGNVTGPGDNVTACGDVPYYVFNPNVVPERAAEDFWQSEIRRYWEVFGESFFERYVSGQRIDVGYFVPGESLRWVRNGNFSSDNVLLAKHGDRFWTLRREISPGCRGSKS